MSEEQIWQIAPWFQFAACLFGLWAIYSLNKRGAFKRWELVGFSAFMVVGAAVGLVLGIVGVS